MIGRVVSHLPVLAAIAAGVAVVVLPSYHLSVATHVMIAAIVCCGIGLMTGVAGMISFGQAAFVGLGAYATAVTTTSFGLSPWIGLIVALTLAVGVATTVGWVTVRTGGHYLALVTLCLCIGFYYLVGNTPELGLFNGLTGIPPLSIGGWELRSERSTAALALVSLILVVWWVRRILDSRLGRVLRSLRSGGTIAETFGADANRHRLLAFVIAAVLAAYAGWIHVVVQRFVNPTPFGVQPSVEYLFMTVIGGAGDLWGALLGPALVVVLKEGLQEILRPIFGPTTRLELLIFACVMILVLIRAPRGLWPMIAGRLAGRTAARRVVEPIEPLRRHVRPTAGLTVLSATGLTRRFGGLVAVDGVGFDVRAGEILGLLGPNGAGKSTLFNLLTGVVAPNEGDVRLLGETIPRISSRDMCRRGVSRTFQHVKLVPGMTLIENVALGATGSGRCGLLAATFGWDRDEERRLLGTGLELLGRVGLAERAWDDAASLSLGHQRILEIARALASDPVLLLLDEPAAGLRANEKRDLAALLKRLSAEGIAILLVEHDMEFVTAVADRLMVMNFGRRIAIGAPAEVCADAGVREAYLGVAA